MAIVKMMGNEDYIIERVFHSLREHAFGDIIKAANGGSKMGAFILCSCLIDSVAGFLKGNDSNRHDYINFVNSYLKEYDGTKLYKDLRCKLVHSYSEGGSYNFIDSKPERHLEQINNKININLENLMESLKQIIIEIESKAKNIENKELRNNIINRYNSNGIIQVFEVNSLTTSTSPMAITTAGYSVSGTN